MTTPPRPPPVTEDYYSPQLNSPKKRTSPCGSSASSSSPPQPLNFQNYFKSKHKFKSVLSPRRSSRLLDKVNIPKCVENNSQDNSSDLGSSIRTNVGCGGGGGGGGVVDVSLEVLSDEVSVLSIEDLQPPPLVESPLKQSPKILPKKSIAHTLLHYHTPSGIYSLLPQRTTYNFRTHLTLKQTTPPLSYLHSLNIHTPYSSLLTVTSDYDFTLKPLVSMPFNCQSDYVAIFHEKKLLTKTTTKNNFVTFFLHGNGQYLLLPRRHPLKIRSLLTPDNQLSMETKKPRVEIKFKRRSVSFPLMTELEVHHDNYVDVDFGNENEALACHVICLSPNSISFKRPVVVRLEVVEYGKVVGVFPGAKLKVHQRQQESKKLIDFRLIENEGKTFVEFEVVGFSFFRVVWDLFTGQLVGAKVGLSALFQKNHHMKCRATMDEYENDRFGLEVSVYKAEKQFPEVQNYSHVVGRSLSKLVKTGKLIVHLKSSLFEADLNAGEELGLVKDEEFWGQDFTMQFALKFKGTTSRGPFGKVLVKRQETIIFEFNLQRQGNEDQTSETQEDMSTRWSTLTLQELATNLFITDGNNWVKFAKHVGFTRQEIKVKFKNTTDPFTTIIEAYKSRGGTPEEFINSLYEVHREIKMNGQSGSPSDSISSRISSSKSSGFGSIPRRLRDTLTSSSSSDNSEKNDSLISKTPPLVVSSRKRKKRGKKGKSKRRKYDTASDVSESEEEHKKRSNHSEKRSNHSEKLKNDMRLLDSTLFWDFSALLNQGSAGNWKALGRTLQIQESTLINIEQSHKSTGNRECHYQVLLAWKESHPKKCCFSTLYCALVKEGMVNIAKKMTSVFGE